MKKFLVKILSIVLSFCFIFSLSISVYAEVETPNDIKNKIIETLQANEYTKDKLGLAGINFEDFEISENPIIAYIFVNNNFEKSFESYPLFVKNELKAFAIKIGSGSDSVYQITTALVSNITDKHITNLSIALIYDDDSCYLYNGNNLILLAEFADEFSNRDDITATNNIDFSTIEIRGIGTVEKLGYTNQNMARVPIYYECDVDFVSQNPPSNLCWAASISSIVGWLLNTEPNDAEFVAWFHYEGDYDNYNRGLPFGDEVTVLGYYDITYQYSNSVPSGVVIYENIVQGFPIYASFSHSNGSHAVVLYGVNLIASIYYIMDPEYGFCSATYNSEGDYVYTSLYSGVELTFRRASCRFLTV